MLSKRGLDELNPTSRAFYERSLMKMNLSLVFAAFAFMFLGFCAMTATKSAVNNQHPSLPGGKLILLYVFELLVLFICF
jgi:hypothetical protein